MSAHFFYSNFFTSSRLGMETVFEVVMWINIFVSLPFTILIFCCVFYVVRKDEVSVYSTSLLISNLIHICAQMVWVAKLRGQQTTIISEFLFFFGLLASLYLKMCIALQRYFFITSQLLDCMRQTMYSVQVCLLVWVLCIITVTLAILLNQFEHILIFALFPALLFIFSLAGTLKALPAATSVPTEEKRRIVGTLIILLLSYFLIILPQIICCLLRVSEFIRGFEIPGIISALFLLSPFIDLILFLFMWNWNINKLLVRLRHSRVDTTAAVTDGTTERQVE